MKAFPATLELVNAIVIMAYGLLSNRRQYRIHSDNQISKLLLVPLSMVKKVI
jgi:hypothetical protein